MYSCSCMLADEITLGMRVRYPRTGTTGAVVRIEQQAGTLFAELDSTHLLYRADQLITADQIKVSTVSVNEDIKEKIRKERDFASSFEYQEALKNIDQSCEGGG